MNNLKHIEAVKSYTNGNITDFKEYIRKISKKELLILLGYFEDYGYSRRKLLWLLEN